MPRSFTMPTNRQPTQQEFADALGLDCVRYSAVANGRRRVTTGTALRLAKVLGTSVELWLNIQIMCDLHEAQNGADGNAARALKPLARDLVNSGR